MLLPVAVLLMEKETTFVLSSFFLADILSAALSPENFELFASAVAEVNVRRTCNNLENPDMTLYLVKQHSLKP